MSAVMKVREFLTCKHCSSSTRMSESNARVNGWRIWRGKTQSGADKEDVICPLCGGGRAGEELPKAASWRVGCNTCDWEWEDEFDEGPLDRNAAQQMADDHECEPDTWVKPPLAGDQS